MCCSQKVTKFCSKKIRYAKKKRGNCFEKKFFSKNVWKQLFLKKFSSNITRHSVFKTVYVPYFRLFRKHKNFKCL